VCVVACRLLWLVTTSRFAALRKPKKGAGWWGGYGESVERMMSDPLFVSCVQRCDVDEMMKLGCLELQAQKYIF
jgi:hypothetical protein